VDKGTDRRTASHTRLPLDGHPSALRLAQRCGAGGGGGSPIPAPEAGAKRALVLAVSGAFHSPLMEPAREELAAAIADTAFKVPFCPIYQNVTSLPSKDPETIKENLLKQLTSPVKWTQSVRNMLADGADTFIEFGPGTVLQGLVKKISASQEPPVSILGYQSL